VCQKRPFSEQSSTLLLLAAERPLYEEASLYISIQLCYKLPLLRDSNIEKTLYFTNLLHNLAPF
jgi:hypothetical protein